MGGFEEKNPWFWSEKEIIRMSESFAGRRVSDRSFHIASQTVCVVIGQYACIVYTCNSKNKESFF